MNFGTWTIKLPHEVSLWKIKSQQKKLYFWCVGLKKGLQKKPPSYYELWNMDKEVKIDKKIWMAKREILCCEHVNNFNHIFIKMCMDISLG
jgi:hypothetical protein